MRSEFQPVEMMSHIDRKEFERTIEELFKAADLDGNGLLDIHEMQRCLGDPAMLGIHSDDIKFLMEIYDEDNNKAISLDEFKMMAYEQLANLSREKAIMAAMASGY